MSIYEPRLVSLPPTKSKAKISAIECNARSRHIYLGYDDGSLRVCLASENEPHKLASLELRAKFTKDKREVRQLRFIEVTEADRDYDVLLSLETAGVSIHLVTSSSIKYLTTVSKSDNAVMFDVAPVHNLLATIHRSKRRIRLFSLYIARSGSKGTLRNEIILEYDIGSIRFLPTLDEETQDHPGPFLLVTTEKAPTDFYLIMALDGTILRRIPTSVAGGVFDDADSGKRGGGFGKTLGGSSGGVSRSGLKEFASPPLVGMFWNPYPSSTIWKDPSRLPGSEYTDVLGATDQQDAEKASLHPFMKNRVRDSAVAPWPVPAVPKPELLLMRSGKICVHHRNLKSVYSEEEIKRGAYIEPKPVGRPTLIAASPELPFIFCASRSGVEVFHGITYSLLQDIKLSDTEVVGIKFMRGADGDAFTNAAHSYPTGLEASGQGSQLEPTRRQRSSSRRSSVLVNRQRSGSGVQGSIDETYGEGGGGSSEGPREAEIERMRRYIDSQQNRQDLVYIATPTALVLLRSVRTLMIAGTFSHILEKPYEEIVSFLACIPYSVNPDRFLDFRRNLGYELLSEGKYDRALANLWLGNASAKLVVGLFPQLLPYGVVLRLQYPAPLQPINNADLPDALPALIKFLLRKRVQVGANQPRSSIAFPDTAEDEAAEGAENHSSVALIPRLYDLVVAGGTSGTVPSFSADASGMSSVDALSTGQVGSLELSIQALTDTVLLSAYVWQYQHLLRTQTAQHVDSIQQHKGLVIPGEQGEFKSGDSESEAMAISRQIETLRSNLLELLSDSNRVYIDESEALLKSVSLDEELVVLYRTKGLHRKALSLLMTRLEECADPGSDETVHRLREMQRYLRQLGPKDLKLIFTYSAQLLSGAMTSEALMAVLTVFTRVPAGVYPRHPISMTEETRIVSQLLGFERDYIFDGQYVRRQSDDFLAREEEEWIKETIQEFQGHGGELPSSEVLRFLLKGRHGRGEDGSSGHWSGKAQEEGQGWNGSESAILFLMHRVLFCNDTDATHHTILALLFLQTIVQHMNAHQAGAMTSMASPSSNGSPAGGGSTPTEEWSALERGIRRGVTALAHDRKAVLWFGPGLAMEPLAGGGHRQSEGEGEGHSQEESKGVDTQQQEGGTAGASSHSDRKGLQPPMQPGRCSISQEQQELKLLRQRFLKFLRDSPHYDAQVVAGFLPPNSFYEEQVQLLQRSDKHGLALVILLHCLGDMKAADEYIQQVVARDPSQGRTLHRWFLQACLLSQASVEETLKTGVFPPTMLGVLHGDTTNDVATVEEALNVLCAHVDQLDPSEIVELLPGSTPIAILEPFLHAVTVYNHSRERTLAIQKTLNHQQHVGAIRELKQLSDRRFMVTRDTISAIGNKRLQTPQVAVYPNGIIVGAKQSFDKHICPETGVDFRTCGYPPPPPKSHKHMPSHMSGFKYSKEDTHG